MHEHATTARLLARLVRLRLERQTFASLADLVADLKAECARLRIDWSSEDIAQALQVVASNRALVTPPLVAVQHSGRERSRSDQRGPDPHGGTDISRAEAAAILQRLGVHLPART
jgi:hypothetical protein